MNDATLAATSIDENQQRLQTEMLSDSIIRASLDENNPNGGIQNYQVEFSKDDSLLDDHHNPAKEEEDDDHHQHYRQQEHDLNSSLLDIKKTISNDSNFSLNDQRMIADSDSDSTVNNNVTRHSSIAMMNITPSISNPASEDFFDHEPTDPHGISPDENDDDERPDPDESMIPHESPPEHRIQQDQSKSAESGMQHSNHSGRSRSRSATIRHHFFHQMNGLLGSNDPLYSEIDIGIHEYSAILYRLIDLACTQSEILQLQVSLRSIHFFPFYLFTFFFFFSLFLSFPE